MQENGKMYYTERKKTDVRRCMKMVTVNAMGDACPIPVIKTKKALESLGGPDTVEVFVDNETAVKNVCKLAESTGASAVWEKQEEGKYRIEIAASDASSGKDIPVACTECGSVEEKGGTEKGTVVVVSSDRMGEGSEELGKILIKGFLFAVTQLDSLPEKMLFYNGGARLTVEGAETLADLKLLEEEGVEILTCGTCLDYYGIKEQLAVGTVTNMYSIVETMQQAKKILRP